MRVVMTEIKNELLSKKCLGAIGIAAVLLLISVSKEMYKAILHENYTSGFHNELFLKSSTSQLAILSMAVICCVPCAVSYIEDVKSRYLLFRLMRSSKKEYIVSKIVSSYIVGGLTVVLAFLLFYGILCIGWIPVEIPIEDVVPVTKYFAEYGKLLLIYFCVGGFFSLASMTLGSITMNYYIAYVSSFILFYLLLIFHQRYFKGYALLDPVVWITKYESYPFNILGAAGMSLVLTLLFGVIFTICVDRRHFDD